MKTTPYTPTPAGTALLPKPRRLRTLTLLMAGIGMASVAAAQKGSPLQCQRATVTEFAACSPFALCPGPGSGPGMSQVLGTPSTLFGVTGSGWAGGLEPFSGRAVYVDYHVPDVRSFAPSTIKVPVMPVTTRTWIVKSPTVPGTYTPVWTKTHALGTVADVSTSQNLTTTDAGSSPTTASWLLVGQVSALALVKNYYVDVTYGFVCKVPVQNLLLQLR